MSERRLLHVQAISGLLFSLFLAAHLLAVMASAFGPGRFDAVQGATRPIYQSPPYELGLLFAPLVVHVVAGLRRARIRHHREHDPRPSRAARLHRYTGWFLALFVFGHAAATRLPSLLLDVRVDFLALAYSMERVPLFFYPYYPLLGLAGLYHGTYGVLLTARLLGLRVPAPGRLGLGPRVVWIAAAAVLVLGVVSFTGALYSISEPSRSPFAALLDSWLPGN